jgi:hypothetical protein
MIQTSRKGLSYVGDRMNKSQVLTPGSISVYLFSNVRNYKRFKFKPKSLMHMRPQLFGMKLLLALWFLAPTPEEAENHPFPPNPPTAHTRIYRGTGL